MKTKQILESLRQSGRKLIFAESLTGGLLVDAFVSIPGASDVVLGAEVTYASELKVALLGVDANDLASFGAVSQQVATQMVQGVRAVGQEAAELGDGQVLAVSTTGNAGPNGLPVGLVFIGLADGAKTKVREFQFSGSRQEIREQAVLAAVDLIGEHLGL